MILGVDSRSIYNGSPLDAYITLTNKSIASRDLAAQMTKVTCIIYSLFTIVKTVEPGVLIHIPSLFSLTPVQA